MQISIPRLRSFVEAGEAAHAAITVANQRWRAARRAVEDARTALRIYDDTAHAQAKSVTADRFERARAKLERELAVAVEAVEAAEAAQERARDIHALAGTLASRARNHAAEVGVLPADLVRD